ncbi:MAG: SPOR domain-containing protein [Bryobacterales bacterium]|nr:SPOR domain-containing protein [Bryobacterales bacterium]
MQDPIDDQLAIVLGQRQLMAVCCMSLTVLGLVATLAYVAGRTITVAQVQARDSVAAEVAHPMVVDPPSALEARMQSLPERTQVQMIPAVPATIGAVPMPSIILPARNTNSAPVSIGSAVAAPVIITPPKPAAPPIAAPAVAAASTEPARGQVFWQIGLVDPDTARGMQSRATGLGLVARTAAGNSPQTRRVLVGPLISREDIARVKQTLDSQQMQAFLKIY